MGFTLPTFNVGVNVWRRGNAVTNPPDVQFTGNLSAGRRVLSPETLVSYAMVLLCPKLADIRGHNTNPSNGDIVEVPAGSGRYYNVFFVDDYGKGFPNEHRFAILQQGRIGLGTPNWPLPIP